MIFRHSAQEGGQVIRTKHRPPFPPRDIPGTHLCQRMSRPQGHSTGGRIKSMKNINDSTENRTLDLPACTAVPQPTTYRIPQISSCSNLCTSSVFRFVRYYCWSTFICAANIRQEYLFPQVDSLVARVSVNPLTPELNSSAQRYLTRFFTGDFASWTLNFVNICVKNQQMQQLFSLLIMYGISYMFWYYIAILRERS
jgi:hypothetical protein